MICDKIEECKEEFNHSNKTLKDKKGGRSIYKIDNNSNSNYSIIDFENCVYEGRQNDTKCDYGLLVNDTIYYIELKGSNISHGIEQLLVTIKDTEKCFKDVKKKARLVVTRYSKPNIIKKKKQYIDLIKKLGKTNDLIISQLIITDKI